jgi:aerobic-type carbon monoxide dehydrogenase small subunit (CoxS/CutS family)
MAGARGTPQVLRRKFHGVKSWLHDICSQSRIRVAQLFLMSMDTSITFTVNGRRYQHVPPDPDRPLLDVLREDLQLTGTKCGCREGRCGACTVLINGKSVPSCLTPISKVDQAAITTIEGLSSQGKLHPVQEAFLQENAYQCGYCTPGMIMGVVGLLNVKPQPTEAEIQSHMEGHLCRCCGYPRILKAVHRVIQQA